MRTLLVLCIAASFAFTTVALADPPQRGRRHGPCEQIVQACRNAGFVKGAAKQGDGLWLDCVNPIMQGVTTVPGATKPLPAVDPGLVTACKAKRPKFGSGKVGSK